MTGWMWDEDGNRVSYTYTVRTDDRNYYLKDHLGSNRMTINSLGVVTNVQDYYAYGEVLRSYNNSTPNEKYKFTGKERDTETDLDYFGARFYDSEIGRWTSVDPLASKFPGWTPYKYCMNNPLGFFDPDGKIELPLKGNSAVNKRDVPNGGRGLSNTIVRTSTYREIRNIGTSPHIGIDYRANVGTPIYNLGNGVVTDIGSSKKGGNYMSVEYSKNGDKMTFRHLSAVANDVTVGSKVSEGQVIGFTGNSGNVQPHLHIDGVNNNGNPINPEQTNYGNFTNEQFFGDNNIYNGGTLNEVTVVGKSNPNNSTVEARPLEEIKK